MKLKEPAMEEMPSTWRPSIQKSTERIGQRGVPVPALAGRLAEEPAHVEEDRAEQENPEAERVQPGEGDVTGADL
jgi:hypothetical protein